MLEFLQSNIYSIVVVLIILLALLFFYKRGNKEFVRKAILGLVVQAEKSLGSGTGELKYAMVVENIYKTLPSILTLLFTKKELDQLIEHSVGYMKKYLRDNESRGDLLGYEAERGFNNMHRLD